MKNLLYNESMNRSLAQAIARGDASMGSIPGVLRQIIEGEMWREFLVPESGEIVRYERITDFITTQPLNGLGTTTEVVRALCQRDAETLAKLERLLNGEHKTVRDEPGNPTGNNQYKRNSDMSEFQSPATVGGNSTAYTISRLKRDAPDIAELVVNGEISAAEGRRRAGWEKEKIAIRLDDPASAAKTIRGRASAEFIEELIALLKDGDE